jgi:hypothetical protein
MAEILKPPKVSQLVGFGAVSVPRAMWNPDQIWCPKHNVSHSVRWIDGSNLDSLGKCPLCWREQKAAEKRKRKA